MSSNGFNKLRASVKKDAQNYGGSIQISNRILLE